MAVHDGMDTTLLPQQLYTVPGQGHINAAILCANDIRHWPVIEIKRVLVHILAELAVDIFNAPVTDQPGDAIIYTGMHENKRSFPVCQFHAFIEPGKFPIRFQKQLPPLVCRCIHHARRQTGNRAIGLEGFDLLAQLADLALDGGLRHCPGCQLGEISEPALWRIQAAPAFACIRHTTQRIPALQVQVADLDQERNHLRTHANEEMVQPGTHAERTDSQHHANIVIAGQQAHIRTKIDQSPDHLQQLQGARPLVKTVPPDQKTRLAPCLGQPEVAVMRTGLFDPA